MNINNKITQYEVTTQIARLSPSEMGLSSSAHKAILVSFTQALGYTDRYSKTREYLVTWISNKTVAELSGSNRDYVGKVLNYLEYCGWLKSSNNMDNSKDYVWIGVQSVSMTFKEWEQAGKPKAVKKPKAEVKVKEEIKQNPMPTNEHVETSVPPVMDVLEKPSISVAESVEAVTESHVDDDLTAWVLKQEVTHDTLNQNVVTKPELKGVDATSTQYVSNVNLDDFLAGTVYLSYEEFKLSYAQIEFGKEELTDQAKRRYADHIKEYSEEIPF